MRYRSILLLAFLFQHCFNLYCQNQRSNRLIIANVNVIPLYKDTLLRGMDVFIENGKIQDLKQHAERGKSKLRKGLFIDGKGKYLMPALIDCHVHYGSNAALFQTYDSLYFQYGIVKGLALNGTPQLLQHRDSIRKGLVYGPEFQCSGPKVNDPSMTALQAKKLLQSLRDAGYDFVKIYSDLSKEGFYEISREAFKYRLRIAGHIPQRVTTSGVLHSNQELIAHAEEFLYNPPVNYLMGNIEIPEKPNPIYIPALADSVRFYQKAVSPTLIAFKSILQSAINLEAYVKTVPLVLSHPIAIAWQWSKETSFIPKKFSSPLSISRLQFGYEYQLKLVSAFNRAGVLLLAGTDAPTIPGLVPGLSLHQEMQLLHEAGLSNYEALKAATINPAHFLKIHSDFGTIEVGKEASLLMLNKNPLENISNTLEIESVFVKGKRIKNK
ncbi:MULTISPECIES: amidohydrolase family protein [Niastella]|uniref:Amidohydrolase family protein n=1 Tax=Niastella soli TaxID=2821487 RepID=A0ABS3YP88_9BACT|nr:amidohydrolase family protein [Niastella soli]MBO9199422.1 amidohydrolase family protein [Niastella soli]